MWYELGVLSLVVVFSCGLPYALYNTKCWTRNDSHAVMHAAQQGAVPRGTAHRPASLRRYDIRLCALVNYYAVLDVDVEASKEEIKRAFRQKAKLLHPDVNKAADADKSFRLLRRAHDVLSDQMLRTEHDRQLDLPSARASDPRFARFERWRREVVPDLRLQLDVWGAEIYLLLATVADTLQLQEQQVLELLQCTDSSHTHDSKVQAVSELVNSMQGVLQDALSNAQRLYDKRYQQVEVRYPAYPAIVWYDVWEEVSDEWLAAASKLDQEWGPRISSIVADSAVSAAVC